MTNRNNSGGSNRGGGTGLGIGIGTILLIILGAIVLRFVLNLIVDGVFVIIVVVAIAAFILYVWNRIRGRKR